MDEIVFGMQLERASAGLVDMRNAHIRANFVIIVGYMQHSKTESATIV